MSPAASRIALDLTARQARQANAHFILLDQRRHQQRHEKNPKDRQSIREIHRPNQI